MPYLRILFRLSIAALLLFGLYYIAHFMLFSARGFAGDEPKNSVPTSAVLALATFLGILSQQLYTELSRSSEETFSPVEFFKSFFRRKSFWIAVIVCPIILIAVYKGVGQTTDNLLGYLFAYQNGFFFKTILERQP